MGLRDFNAARTVRRSGRLTALLYGALLAPAMLTAVYGGQAAAGQLTASAFQPYSAAAAASIQAGPLALYTVSVDSLLPTQQDEGPAEVGKKTAGFDLLTPSELPANLLTDIEPVVIGPGGKLYLTDGHHTFTALEDSIYGPSDPTVYVNVIANFSNLTTTQFFAAMQADHLLLPLNDGVPETVNLSTGAPLPTSLTGLTTDNYRGLEYSILKNKSSKLFTTASNITGAVGAATPGLDKMTGLYSDFFEAAAYRDANGGRGLAYLSPGDIALATQWNLNPASLTSLPNVAGVVTAAQLPGFILNQNVVNSGGISNATLATGALAGNNTFTGLTSLNAGTTANPITIGTPNLGFVMQLGNDAGDTVTLDGVNSYTGGTSILAGHLIVQSDASLGAAVPVGATINPAAVLASVQAANGIVFNSLTEGNGTLTLGTTTGGTFSTSRPIAVDGEMATIDVNDNTVTLNGQIVSLGTFGVGIGNATGESDLTIDDLSAADAGKLILSQASPYFYGNIIIGSTGAPTVEVMNDAALGNTTGPAGSIGEVELNGGTLQAGASFSAPERNLFLGGGSSFDVNGFTTSWGALTDIQRTLEVLNSSTTAGAVTFSSLTIGATSTLQLAGGTAGESVTFTNGVSRTGNDTLILNGSTATSLGTTEKVFNGAGAASLVDTIAPVWIVTDNGGKKGAGPYDFVTYGANGYVKATYDATTLTAATGADVIALAANSTAAGNVAGYALNTEGKTIALGGHTLTLGDGVDPAGLILATGSQINNGTLAFGASNGVIWLSGTNPTIGATITGSNGLTFAGSGSVAIGAAANVSGLITVDSGTVTLTAANVFANDASGLLLDDVKKSPAPSTLAITANNAFSTLNSVGNNSTITIGGGAILTIGDSNNLSSTILSTITDTTVTAGAITKNGTGLLDLSGATVTLAAGSSIVANGGALRVATGALKNTAVAGSAPNFVLANGADLQFAQSGGGQYAGAISGAGTLHLIGGTLQLTGTSNSYTGGTIVETGSILDITTANLPTANPNITDAGGLIVFDQATSGSYNGVISNGAEMGTGPVLAGSLDKDDSSGANAGNVTLTQAQTFTGATTIEAGTLTLGAVNTLATSSGVDLGRVGGGSTATLALAANNSLQALTSETGDTTSVTLGANTLTLANAASTTAVFGGVISGAGSVVKTGAGTQVLSGANVYSGGTTVQAGVLGVTGSIKSTGAATVAGGTLDIANGGALAVSAATVSGGALVTSGAVTVSAATTVSGGTLDVANSGSFNTGSTTVSGGVLELDSGSTFNTATLTVGAAGMVEAGGGSLASAAGTFNNAGLLDLRNGAATNTFTVGAYNGVAGSEVLVGVNFASGQADKLVVASAAGSSQIVVTDLSPKTAAAYNPTGIPVVISASAMNPSIFSLAGGPIQKGLFEYDLAYSPDPRFVLVGVPTADAFRLTTLPSAAQSIWQDAAGVWLDRQVDLRDVQGGSTAAGGPQADGVWVRTSGAWADRSQAQSYSVLNKTYDYQTGYDQSTGSMFGGLDGAVHGLASHGDTLMFGAEVGYIGSDQAFKDSSTRADYEGSSVGLSATYLNRGFFIDELAEADFLRLHYSDPSIAGFGPSQQTVSVRTLGAIVDTGYRFGFGGSAFGGSAFVEPQASLSDVSSHFGGMSLAGSQIGIGDDNLLRGRLGLRGGATVVDDDYVRIEASATGSYWARLSGGGTTATFDSGVGAPLLSLAGAPVKDYGEVGVGFNILSKKGGWSGFVKADYQFVSGYSAGTVNGGFRYAF